MLRSTAAASADPVEALLAGFVVYLREQRGVSVSTIDAYVGDVRRFLTARGDVTLRNLTAAAVSRAVLGDPVIGRAPATVQRFVCSVRALLRYGHWAGLIESDLSGAVLPMADRRRSLLPQGLTEAQVRALLHSCDRRRSIGRRDYAVIVLMLRLGLRASEVAALQLDDIDWRAGTVTVHGKNARVDQLPLPADVGEAIAGYLQRGRPRTPTREVFVEATPPHASLGCGAVSSVVRRASVRVGLAPFGAHRLRHTAACQMLRAGGSLAEIGQVLRHDSAQTTAEYACVDVERLRTIARPWPAGTAS